MRYSIVSSSKGGTGKSSLSLALAIHYDHVERKNLKEKIKLLKKWLKKEFTKEEIIKYYETNDQIDSTNGKLNNEGKALFEDDNTDPIINYNDLTKAVSGLTSNGKKHLEEKLKYYEDLLKSEKATSCLIDLDVLGTTLELSLFDKKYGQIIKNKNNVDIKFNGSIPEMTIVNSNKIADKYLNDIMRHGFKDTEEILTKIKLPYSSEEDTTMRIDKDLKSYKVKEEVNIDILFASSLDKDKDHFRKHSSTMSVAESVFGNELKKILFHLKEAEYKHIIIDMPPASDLYSSCIYDLLLRDKNKADNTDLYCISTDDSAQVNVCQDSIQGLLENDNYYLPDRIIFAINKMLIPGNIDIYDHIDLNVYLRLFEKLNENKNKILEKSHYISFAKCLIYPDYASFGGARNGLGLTQIPHWMETSMCRSLEQNGLHKIVKDGMSGDPKIDFESWVDKIALDKI